MKEPEILSQRRTRLSLEFKDLRSHMTGRLRALRISLSCSGLVFSFDFDVRTSYSFCNDLS